MSVSEALSVTDSEKMHSENVEDAYGILPPYISG
jgi:hypothetical protein